MKKQGVFIMKKFIFTLILIMAVCQTIMIANAKQQKTKTATTAAPVANNSVYTDTTLNCKQALTQNKPIVVLYTADYCFYCKRFKPIFYHLSHHLSNEYNFVIYDVTRKQQPSICDDIDLNGIPTLFVINPKTGKNYLVPERYYSNPELLKTKLLEYYKTLK